ncbi:MULTISPECIES: AEC family transporter [unclassified Nocardioides]|uniref:AEC family transporter n=1 Tax=unclassified Nocardioides TaxID=2615069 RepID=UPI00301519CF
MTGVFEGFATIAILIGLGILLAHLKVIDDAGRRTLATLALFVASPALLITVLEDTDLGGVFSGNLVAMSAGVLASALPVVLVARWRRRGLGDTVITAMAASYQNAGNLGLPIAAYVLGDASLVAPVLLLQMLLLQPLALTLLDADRAGERISVGKVLKRPFTNPITIATLIGLGLTITGIRLPGVIHDPLELVGGMAVPSMLIAYGVALRLGPLPGRGVPARVLAAVTALKMVVQPTAAYVVGRFLLDLDTPALLAVTVLSALPAAQNVYVISARYDRATLLARDAVFVSTLASVPVILLITALVA